MSASYGQFCPVAKAMELLDERWTMLIIRELMLGSRQFNAIRRGVPRMSPALLSKRLTMLVRAGVVTRRQDGHQVSYQLSESGRELIPIVEAVGAWGIRWIPELGDEDLDPHLLMWDMHRGIDRQEVPDGRTTLEFEFSDVRATTRVWWLVITPSEVDICDVDPGFDVRVRVRTSLRTLSHVWRGDIGWPQAMRAGDLELIGDASARRAFPRWFTLSSLAHTPRPAA